MTDHPRIEDYPLLDRLRSWVQPSHKPYPTRLRNPDGEEAAAEIERLRAALRWYSEKVALVPKITAEGDAARCELDRDRGHRARAALITLQEEK